MQALLILNDPPHGTERTYNGLRLGLALAKTPETRVTVFLMADAVGAAKHGQKTPDGYYTCMDARALAESELVEGAVRSTMDELARETLASDKT